MDERFSRQVAAQIDAEQRDDAPSPHARSFQTTTDAETNHGAQLVGTAKTISKPSHSFYWLLDATPDATIERLEKILGSDLHDDEEGINELRSDLRFIACDYTDRIAHPKLDIEPADDPRVYESRATRNRLRKARDAARSLAGILEATAAEEAQQAAAEAEFCGEDPTWRALLDDPARLPDTAVAHLLGMGLFPRRKQARVQCRPDPYQFDPNTAYRLLQRFADAADEALGNPTRPRIRIRHVKPLSGLVSRLGELFTKCTGREPTVTTDYEDNTPEGPFFDLVMIVVDACAQYDPRCARTPLAIAKAANRQQAARHAWEKRNPAQKR